LTNTIQGDVAYGMPHLAIQFIHVEERGCGQQGM